MSTPGGCSQIAEESLVDGQALTSAAFSRGTPPVVQWSQLGDAQAEPTDSSSRAPSEQPASLPLLLSPPRAALLANTDRAAAAASDVKTQNRFGAFGEETSSSCSADSPRGTTADAPPTERAKVPRSLPPGRPAPVHQPPARIHDDQSCRERPDALAAEQRPPAEQDSAQDLPAESQKPEAAVKKKKARGAKRRAPNRVAEPLASAEAAASPAAWDDSESNAAPLSDENASVLALWTAKLCEKAILVALRDEALQAGKPRNRRLPLAVPVTSCPPRGPEMLDIMLGMVIRCEATDAHGWGFGIVIAPASRTGQRGCFRCENACPVLAELREEQLGTALDCTPATWQELQQPADSSTHGRLRQKALLGRLRAARAAWGS